MATRIPEVPTLPFRERKKIPDARHLWLLSTRLYRPAECQPSECCYELAPPHSRLRVQGIVLVRTSELEGATMSALGQKQTFAVQNGMSALPPKSGHQSAALPCPLWARSGLLVNVECRLQVLRVPRIATHICASAGGDLPVRDGLCVAKSSIIGHLFAGEKGVRSSVRRDNSLRGTGGCG